MKVSKDAALRPPRASLRHARPTPLRVVIQPPYRKHRPNHISKPPKPAAC
jgi:hypothetical protein